MKIFLRILFGSMLCMACIPTFAQKKDTSIRSLSWVNISAAVGNSPYKLENAKGGVSGAAFIKPGITYYHKSGLSISGYTYALLGQQTNGLFEFDVTPAYDYNKGKSFSFGFAYTHYFFNSNSSIEASPLRNEFYGYLNYNNWWLQPAIGLDIETGSYTDTLGPTHRANDEDIFFSLTHQFSIVSLFAQEDELDISPSLALMVGTDKFVRSLGSSRFIRKIQTPDHIIKKKKKKTAKKLYTNTYTNEQARFIPRYAEASIDISYSVGIFTFEPQYFFDFSLAGNKTGDNYFLASVSILF